MNHLKKYNEKIDQNDVRKISDLINFLQETLEKEGDINVCVSEDHEYWGSVQSWLTKGYNINVSEHAQPDGPKSGKSVKALVFGK